MKPILVSTITPCFRMKHYLKKFLDELPYQTMFDQMEVILDHNDPDEEEIMWVRTFQEHYPGRIKHIIVRPVENIGASMNRCIKEGTGIYVAIWNVDDLRTPDSIEFQVKALEEKNGDIAIGDYMIVRRFGEKEKGEMVLHSRIPHSEFLRSMYYGPFVMFKKSLCVKAGYFDEQLTSGADFDLSIRLAYNGKTVLTDKPLGFYLNEGKGASTRPGSKQKLDKSIICLRYGIFDKVDVSYLPLTVQYSIPHIISFGKMHEVKSFVHNYEQIIKSNTGLITTSMMVSTLSTISGYQIIKSKLKTFVKNIIYRKK